MIIKATLVAISTDDTERRAPCDFDTETSRVFHIGELGEPKGSTRLEFVELPNGSKVENPYFDFTRSDGFLSWAEA